MANNRQLLNMTRIIPKYDRQALVNHIERMKRKDALYGSVTRYGWFYIDYFKTNSQVLDLMYKDVEEFLDDTLAGFLEAEKANPTGSEQDE